MFKSRATRYALLLAAVLAATLLPVSPVRAATIAVTTLQDEYDEAGTGTGCALREAVQAAKANAPFGGCAAGTEAATDVIVLPAGTYQLTLTGANEDRNVTGDLDLLGAVSLRGAGAGRTIIDGYASDRILSMESPSIAVDIRDLTLRNGSARAFGGAIYAEAIDPLPSDSSSVSIIRSQIISNTVDGWGGGVLADIDSLTVIDSEITNNVATGALPPVGGLPPPGRGGGIALFGTDLILRSTTISGNRGIGGDGLSVEGGSSATITNSTIHGNGSGSDEGRGGGIYNSANGAVTLEHVTLSNNYASMSGGMGANLYNDGGTVTTRSTIFALPLAGGNCGGTPPTSSGNNLEWSPGSSGSPCLGGVATDVFADPKLGPLQDNGGRTWTRALGSGSAAVDAGATLTGVTFDQRGAPRPQGAAPDIGAYERAICQGGVVNVVGTPGNDRLIGTAGNDVIAGFGGNDRIYGRGGNDRLCGGEGADDLRGESGDDRLDGGRGNDTLRGGSGADRYVGGPGIDRASFVGAVRRVVVDLSSSPGTAAGEGSDTLTGVENVDGSPFNDLLRGSGFANLLRGLGGHDDLFGLGRNDILEGNSGNDDFNGGSGTDTCRQGTGTGTKISCER